MNASCWLWRIICVPAVGDTEGRDNGARNPPPPPLPPFKQRSHTTASAVRIRKPCGNATTTGRESVLDYIMRTERMFCIYFINIS